MNGRTCRKLIASSLVCLVLPAAAQSVPAANFTDMWWNPNESGWGLSIAQHPSNKMFAVWFTYDPREPETSTPETTDFKPLWLVFPNSTWVSPTQATGPVFVTSGTPFFQAWNPSALQLQEVGTFTFNFTDANNGSFTYDISPPAGLAANNPAFGLAPFSGTRAITRQSF